MTLLEKMFDTLDKEIHEREEVLRKRHDMRERLKQFSNEELSSMIGLVLWYYKKEYKE